MSFREKYAVAHHPQRQPKQSSSQGWDLATLSTQTMVTDQYSKILWCTSTSTMGRTTHLIHLKCLRRHRLAS
jgi:hypothetical protein